MVRFGFEVIQFVLVRLAFEGVSVRFGFEVVRFGSVRFQNRTTHGSVRLETLLGSKMRKLSEAFRKHILNLFLTDPEPLGRLWELQRNRQNFDSQTPKRLK